MVGGNHAGEGGGASMTATPSKHKGRSQTRAPEKALQRSRLKARAEAELGRPVSHNEAARWNRARKADSVPDFDYFVKDKQVHFEPEEVRRIGRFMGRVQDVKVQGRYVVIAIQTDPVFAHVATDVGLVSANRSVLMTVDELIPLKELKEKVEEIGEPQTKGMDNDD